MANNCLVTKLKGSVSNRYMRKLGKICVYWDSNFNGRSSLFNNGLSEQEITLVGNGYFSDISYQQNLGSTITIHSSDTVYMVISGECYLEVNDPEYSLNSVAFGASKVHADDFKARDFSGHWLMLGSLIDGSFTEEGSLNNIDRFRLYDGVVDLNVFKGMTGNVSSVDIHGNAKAYGDISAFDNVNLASIVYFNNSGITGDVAHLAKCVSATNFQLQYTDIYGTLESLAAGLFDNGKNSGSVPVTLGSSKISFNNRLYTGGDTLTMEFSASSVAITNGLGTTYATYDGTDWTYNS